MPKYINAGSFVIPKGTVDDIAKRGVIAIHDLLDIQPSADVVEVEPLRKRIKADLEEANETLTNGQYMSKNVKSFQQGRIFAHKYDLSAIERMLKNDGERKETE